MSGKELKLGIVLISAILVGLIYEDYRKKSDSVEQMLGPPSYVPGPNAESDECQKLKQEWGPMLDRQTDEDNRAEARDSAQVEQLERTQMSDAQRQIAMNNLSAKQDIAKTARESRQKNEEIKLRERLRVAGCQQLNPQLSK